MVAIRAICRDAAEALGSPASVGPPIAESRTCASGRGENRVEAGGCSRSGRVALPREYSNFGLRGGVFQAQNLDSDRRVWVAACQRSWSSRSSALRELSCCTRVVSCPMRFCCSTSRASAALVSRPGSTMAGLPASMRDMAARTALRVGFVSALISCGDGGAAGASVVREDFRAWLVVGVGAVRAASGGPVLPGGDAMFAG